MSSFTSCSRCPNARSCRTTIFRCSWARITPAAAGSAGATVFTGAAVSAGATFFVVKPLDLEQLANRILRIVDFFHDVLELPPSRRTKEMHFATILLDDDGNPWFVHDRVDEDELAAEKARAERAKAADASAPRTGSTGGGAPPPTP